MRNSDFLNVITWHAKWRLLPPPPQTSRRPGRTEDHQEDQGDDRHTAHGGRQGCIIQHRDQEPVKTPALDTSTSCHQRRHTTGQIINDWKPSKSFDYSCLTYNANMLVKWQNVDLKIDRPNHFLFMKRYHSIGWRRLEHKRNLDHPVFISSLPVFSFVFVCSYQLKSAWVYNKKTKS